MFAQYIVQVHITAELKAYWPILCVQNDSKLDGNYLMMCFGDMFINLSQITESICMH